MPTAAGTAEEPSAEQGATGGCGAERERNEGHAPRCVKDELEEDLFAAAAICSPHWT